jgi:hypothetical protein
VLNQLTEDQRKELKKREILTYARRNKIHFPPPQTSVHPPPEKQAPSQPRKEAPSQPTEKVIPPPPPLVHDLLPKPTQVDEEIQLNIDIPTMIGKMNMSVPMVEMCKIPSVRREVLKVLKVPAEAEDPPVILNTMYHG